MANEINRARAIMGNLASDDGTPLDNTKALKFVDAVATTFGPQQGLTPAQIAAMTTAQKATMFIQVMRGFLLDVRRASQANAAAEAARKAAVDAVNAGDAPDLGG